MSPSLIFFVLHVRSRWVACLLCISPGGGQLRRRLRGHGAAAHGRRRASARSGARAPAPWPRKGAAAGEREQLSSDDF